MAVFKDGNVEYYQDCDTFILTIESNYFPTDLATLWDGKGTLIVLVSSTQSGQSWGVKLPSNAPIGAVVEIHVVDANPIVIHADTGASLPYGLGFHSQGPGLRLCRTGALQWEQV